WPTSSPVSSSRMGSTVYAVPVISRTPPWCRRLGWLSQEQEPRTGCNAFRVQVEVATAGPLMQGLPPARGVVEPPAQLQFQTVCLSLSLPNQIPRWLTGRTVSPGFAARRRLASGGPRHRVVKERRSLKSYSLARLEYYPN